MTTSVHFDQYEDVLRKHLPYAGDAPLAGSNVLADLGLNSLGVVRLLADIESTFDIELPDEALTPATFETVDSLWQAVHPQITGGVSS